jgi:nucleoside-diphosphate-sugar epimerase
MMSQNDMKRILITGASGFLGRHCVPLLLDRGYEVHAVLHNRPSGSIEHKNLFYHQCDLLNGLEHQKLLSGIKPSHFLHLAWYAVPGKYWTSLENLNWVQASLGMTIEFIRHGGRRFVCAGSSAEYDWPEGYCSEKHTPLKPASLYGTCKNSLHDILSQLSKQEGLSYAWGRLFFVYGPHEYPERLVSSMILKLFKNQVAHCQNPDLIRDFLYIQDAADAFVSLLDSHVTGPVNIASGAPVTIRELVTRIADKMDKRHLLRISEKIQQLNEPISLTADVDRLCHEVSWTPKYDVDRALDENIAWWQRHREGVQNSKHNPIEDN